MLLFFFPLAASACSAVESSMSIGDSGTLASELYRIALCEVEGRAIEVVAGREVSSIALAGRLRSVWDDLASRAGSMSCDDKPRARMHLRIVDSIPGGMRALATDYGPSIFVSSGGLAGVNDSMLERVLTHELIHVYVDRVAGRMTIPEWFDEGIASIGGATLECTDSLTLAVEVAAGRTEQGGEMADSLAALRILASGLRRADPATSGLLVAWLFSPRVPASVDAVVRASRQRGFPGAFSDAFGQEAELAVGQFAPVLSVWAEKMLHTLECGGSKG